MENVKSVSEIQSLSGAYLLILKSQISTTIEIGKIGSMDVQKGYYFYVGSAFGPGGIKARVNRHLKHDKSLRWHIDYLRSHCLLKQVFISYSTEKQESDWVYRLLHHPSYSIAFNRFGASDSCYPSHLFYSATLATDEGISHALATEGLIKLTSSQH